MKIVSDMALGLWIFSLFIMVAVASGPVIIIKGCWIYATSLGHGQRRGKLWTRDNGYGIPWLKLL